MAFLLNKASMLSQRLQSSSSSTSQAQAQAQAMTRVENSLLQSQRSYHVQLGDREKALLKDDPSLRRFKSHKKALYRLKRFGDALTIIVVTGCCYEIYVKATMREEARKQAHEQS